jgi:3',5'-cyclic AMP phosphodiesterase CpdA
MAIFKLGHVTDVHLGPIRGLSPRYWNVKRALGYANWQRGRVDAHRRDVADRLIADLQAQRPDHIAITGDLVNLGLPREHEGALSWLQTVGEADRVSVIPGNHDIYSSLHGDIGVARWQRYMAGDLARDLAQDMAPGAIPPAGMMPQFPYVRRFARLALVGLNSAVETAPLVASGELGEAQRARLATILQTLDAERAFAVVMIHHPPLSGQAPASRGLRDAKALEYLLGQHNPGLVIHGHNHRNMTAWRAGRSAAFPIIGAPSLSMAHAHKGDVLGRYNLYQIDTGSRPPTIEMIGRGLAEQNGPIVELERRVLVPPALHVAPEA